MGNTSSDGRGITPRYENVKKQLDATYDLNKRLKENGHRPANGLYQANNKCKQHGLIDTPQFKHYNNVNKKANKAKHSW